MELGSKVMECILLLWSKLVRFSLLAGVAKFCPMLLGSKVVQRVLIFTLGESWVGQRAVVQQGQGIGGGGRKGW